VLHAFRGASPAHRRLHFIKQLSSCFADLIGRASPLYRFSKFAASPLAGRVSTRRRRFTHFDRSRRHARFTPFDRSRRLASLNETPAAAGAGRAQV
jgi:hypothetical protein